MKRTLVSLLAVFMSPLFAATIMCEGDAKGQQRIPAAQGTSAQHPDADAQAERFGFLRGKTLKAGFEQSRGTPVRPRRIEMSGLLGVLRRVPQQYPTIQAGINASVHGDTVLVSEGTHLENIDYLGKRIIVASLYLLDQDTSHVSRTIIDGNQAGSVVSFISGEDTNSVLCGFTVRGGYGTYIPAWDEADGGGVFLWESGGRLVRNIITGNNVEAPNAWGGGVSIAGFTNIGQTLIMEENIVSRNTVTGYAGTGYGGGVVVFLSQFRLIGNVFEHDSSRALREAGGGGVVVLQTSTNQSAGIIRGNVFRANAVLSDSLAAACLTFINTGAVVVDSNIFEDNVVASMHTGALGGAFMMQDVNATFPTKTVSRNIFRRNRMTCPNGGARGAAVMNNHASARIRENLIQDNRAEAGISSIGGGIFGVRWGGTIENNIITGNTSTYGGGMGHTGAPPSSVTQAIMNNTFSRNRAELGGGFYDSGFETMSILLNNIFWGDSSSNGEIYAPGSIEVHYSNIEGGWIGGTGNIDVNPMFADTLYRLGNSSPCIGAGRDSMQIAGIWYRSPTRDFGGNSRPMPSGSQPDMGAWEIGMIVQPQWQLQTTFNGNPPITSVNAVSDRVAWICSTDSVYRTTNGGVNWSPTATTPTSTEDLGCVKAFNATTACVGGTGPGSQGGDAKIYRTTNSGQNWSVVYTGAGPGSYWNAIHFFDAQNGIAFSDPSNPISQFLIVKSTDGGATWTPIASRPLANSGEYGIWNAVYFYDNLNGWFGTSIGRVFRTTDGGNSWTGFDSGNTGAVYGVRFVSPMVGICISTSTPFLRRSTDGGQTWTTVSNLPVSGIQYLFSATGVNTQSLSQLWVVGQAATPVMLTSTDGGATWQEQTLPALPAGEVPHLSAVSFGALNDSVQAFGATFDASTATSGGRVLSYRQRIGYVTGANEHEGLPSDYSLSQNYPNPFNPSTKIVYRVKSREFVELRVFDLLGRVVATLVNEVKQSGTHSVGWNAAGVASGVYFYRLEASGFVETKKMILMK